MSELFGGPLPAVESQMRFRAARQAVLAANVANADTPGFRRRELEFDGELQHSMAHTHPGHLGGGGAAGDAGWRTTVSRGPARPDGNTVNPDREILQVSRNASRFREQAEVLSRLLALRSTAITGGR